MELIKTIYEPLSHKVNSQTTILLPEENWNVRNTSHTSVHIYRIIKEKVNTRFEILSRFFILK